jgi:hypothetical protein
MSDKVEKKAQEITRRDFLRGAAVGAVTVAAAGIMGGCASTATPPAETAGPTAQLPQMTSAPQQPVATAGNAWSWESVPADIPEADIKNEVTADVIVIGTGLAGCCAAIAAADKGAKVVCVEKNSEGMYAARGGHTASFGSRVVKDAVGDVDYAQVVRRWIYWAQGRCKEPLLWEFAKKSGACMDWLLDMVEPRGLRTALWDGYYKGPDYTEIPVTHFFYTEGTNFMYQNGMIEGAGQAVLLPVLFDILAEKALRSITTPLPPGLSEKTAR